MSPPIPATLRCLANAIEDLIEAYEATDDDTVADHIREAERECYKALDVLVRSQHSFDDKPFPLSEPESTI